MSFHISRKFFATCGITAAIHDRMKKTDEEKLKINLMYAQEALLYTEKVLPKGAFNNRDDLNEIPFETLQLFLNQRRESQLLVDENVRPYDLNDKALEIVATVAKKYGMRNCGEQAAVAYTYLRNEKNIRKLDYLVLVNGDHAFVVIGKDPLADIHDPTKWGKAAVICETWGKTYFPAEELLDKLNEIGDRPLYDPNVQSIGWTKQGFIPPEVTIRKWIAANQKHHKTFAKASLERFKHGKEADDQLITNCLIDTIKRKSKPKVPPSLRPEQL